MANNIFICNFPALGRRDFLYETNKVIQCLCVCVCVCVCVSPLLFKVYIRSSWPSCTRVWCASLLPSKVETRRMQVPSSFQFSLDGIMKNFSTAGTLGHIKIGNCLIRSKLRTQGISTLNEKKKKKPHLWKLISEGKNVFFIE